MNSRFSLAVPGAASIKAVEDARKVQASITETCLENGQEPPPYTLSELIGKGSFGRVYKAIDKKNKPERVVAVKIINIEEGDTLGPGDTFGDIMKEVNALKMLSQAGARNVNVVLDSLLVGQSVWIVTEHCAGGSVSTLMRPTGFLLERWIIPILREVAEAVFWVHRQGIIHRDIKCANVLITASGNIQLCDFGVAGIVESKFDKRRTVTGTLHWMAPELFNHHVAYGTEVDIWAFGSMAYEVASGLPPNAHVAIDPSGFGSYLGQHCPRLEGNQYSPGLKDLVKFCLVVDPAKRPTIEQVQRHPYLANTSEAYPTHSLSTLMSAYRLWQSRGGGRLSLFNPGGAQGIPSQDEEPLERSPDWDFGDDGDDEDEDGPAWFTPGDSADAQAVYEAYGCPYDGPYAGSEADSAFHAGKGGTAKAPPSSTATPSSFARRGRRRPPPNMKRLEVPLEKVFNPNTLTNYRDNARAVYGRNYQPPPPPPQQQQKKKPPPPPQQPLPPMPPMQPMQPMQKQQSDLPLRNEDAKYPVRESLIDLDASLVPGNDEETIRGLPQPTQRRYSNSVDLDRRRTQDWTFPTAAAPASANSDVLPSDWTHEQEQEHEQFFPPKPARFTQEWTFPKAEAEAAMPMLDLPHSRGSSLDQDNHQRQPSFDRSTTPSNRQSAVSLIDLDMSLVDDEPMGTMQRPSTALSEETGAGSETEDAPFALDYARHVEDRGRMGMPVLNRMNSMNSMNGMINGTSGPSSHDDSRLAREPSMYVPEGIGFLAAVPPAPASEDGQDSVVGVEQHAGGGRGFGPPPMVGGPGLPVAPPPPPPMGRVLEGISTRDEIKGELLRLIDSFSEHLQVTTQTLERLPVRKARRSLTERDGTLA